MSDRHTIVGSDLDDEFEQIGRQSAAELRRLAPEDGEATIERSVRRRRALQGAALASVLVALGVTGVMLAQRHNTVEDEPAPTIRTTPLPERVQLVGHTGIVVGFAISPDGSTIATVGDDSTVRVWDSLTGEQRLAIEFDPDRATGELSFNDGATSVAALVYTLDGATAVRAWSVADGTPQEPFVAEVDLASSQSSISPHHFISPDGRFDVELRRFTGATITDLESGDTIPMRTDTSTAYTAAFSPDGTLVAVKFDNVVRIWDLTTRTELPAIILPGYNSTAERMAFTPDGLRLAFTVEDSVLIERIEVRS